MCTRKYQDILYAKQVISYSFVLCCTALKLTFSLEKNLTATYLRQFLPSVHNLNKAIKNELFLLVLE